MLDLDLVAFEYLTATEQMTTLYLYLFLFQDEKVVLLFISFRKKCSEYSYMFLFSTKQSNHSKCKSMFSFCYLSIQLYI